MAKKKIAQTSGASLRARRKALDYSQGEVERATHGLVRQQHVSSIELEKTVGGDVKARYVAWLEQMEGLQPKNVSDTTAPSQAAPQLLPETRGAYNLACFRPRLAEGNLMAIAAEADFYIKRPEFLSENDKLYAIEMLGDSMSPKCEDGDTLYVSPSVKPQIGKLCVFLTADRRRIQVRILVSQMDEMWVVRQLNPPRETHLSVAEWPFCEAVENIHSPHRK